MRIGIFISGTGSNMVSVIEYFQKGSLPKVENIAFVFSDRKDAPGLEKAAALGIPTLILTKKKGESAQDYEYRLIEAIRPFNTSLIILAGFMKVLSSFFLTHYPGRIINIHPSLLPAFPGVDAQKQAFIYGVKISGCTTHFVDESLDGGPVILQKAVPRLPGDTVQTFKERILAEEHKLLPETVSIISENRFIIEERFVRILDKGEGDET